MGYAARNGIALFRLVALTFAVLSIGSCGGGGGGDSAPVGSKLFVADSGTDAIGSVINSNPAPGNIRIDRVITGTASNGITGTIPALFLDAAKDQLYVSNETQIFVFHNAGTANGPVNYNRRVATFLAGGNFNSLSLDSTRDILYVGDIPNGVRVYDNASTANEAGGGPPNLPSRTISGNFAGNFSIRNIAVDPGKNILYVAVVTTTPDSMSIFSFDNASAVTNQPPNRTITIATTLFTTMGLFLDSAHDRLYVANSLGNVLVFETASIKTGTPLADRTVVLPSVVTRLAVDTVNDRLYAAGSIAVYVVPGVSTASGPVLATAAQAPAGSDFSAVAVRP